MSRVRQVKTTFTAGEVSRSLLGRGDLRAYDNGALTLRNVFIQPTGGVKRRAGLRFVDMAEGDGRLIAFEFSSEQTYLLLLTHKKITIFANDVLIETLDAPWSEEQIGEISWTQSADTLLLMHPEIMPQKLTRNVGGVWLLESWSFYTSANVIYQPYYKFANADVTLTPSSSTGSITLTASSAVFVEEHEGLHLRINGMEVEITAYDSPTVVSANVIQTLTSTAASADWEEPAFSPVHGYPVSVAFHQDRLVIGGSRDLPNRLWFSKSGDLFNFDRGVGHDDEAIEFAILSDQVNAIRGIFSGRHLQVFTSGAEWMVTGDPLTPSTVQIRRQTRTGSAIGRYIPPVNVDGATLFIARNKEQIQEFIYTDIEQAYQVTDLALLSRHIIKDPIDQDFDQRRRLLFLIRADGKFATLTIFRAEAVAAWTLHETNGLARSVAVVGDEVYMLLRRGAHYMVERFDDDLNLDSALTGAAGSPSLTWSGLDHLEGENVIAVADGIVQDARTVEDGAIILDQGASEVEVGIAYTHIIEPLPPSTVSDGGIGRAVRLIEGVFRVENTASMQLDVGRGLRDVAFRKFNNEPVLDAPPPHISGDVRVRALGWQSETDKPLWRIEQSIPLPFTLLSVTTELKVND